MLTANAPLATSAITHQTGFTRPDPEVTVLPSLPARARRRHFTAADKLRVLQEADHSAIGQLSALLRREGLYSSHLANWRRQRARGTLNALVPQRRERPVTPAAEREVAQLRAVARGARTGSPQAGRGGNGDCSPKKPSGVPTPPVDCRNSGGVPSRRPRGVAVSLLVRPSP